MAERDFSGQTAIVTGAGRGIAAALARTLAARGARVGVCDIDAGSAEATVSAIGAAGGDALAIAADVSEEAAVQRAVAKVVERWAGVDILVNAAGSYGKAFRPTHETPIDEWEGVFASNVTGTFLCAKAVLPHMLAAGGGCIVNFSSNAGRSVSPLLGCSYTAAKAAVIGITRHLAHEYAAAGIRVNTIAPGPVDGERVAGLLDATYTKEELRSRIPLGRLASNEDIVEAVLYLASREASFVTGAILDVSGGLVLA